MRFVRIAALVGSLVLLVATAVSVVNRRSELRTAQVAAVEQSSAIAATTIRASVAMVRQDVDVAVLVAERLGGGDDIELARQLVEYIDGAEACVGRTGAGCTGTDLFSLASVADLVVESDGVPDSESAVAVDESTDSIIVAGRIRGDGAAGVVAMRVPLTSLLTADAVEALEAIEANVEISATSTRSSDTREGPTMVDGRRVVSETIRAPFVDGAVVVASGTTGDIDTVRETSFRYGLPFVLGAVLLALAGWTFLVERRRLERRATTDDLTGLINRREFERVSDIAIDAAERDGAGLCVMVVDLNGFKQVNDTLGHQFGDLVLAASSERLVSAVRDTDVVGRWGGDEFVILLPTLAERSAVRNSAERIWHSLADDPVVGDTHMTASIGAAIYPRHGTTLDALMRAADVAMYEAKTTGVSHRIADTIATREAMSDDTGQIPVVEVVTEEYSGPDRRQSPVPPPMRPPSELDRPIVPDAPLRTLVPDDSSSLDGPSIR